MHSGKLRARVAADGGRSAGVNTLGPGELFGELMLSGERRAVTVEVTVRTCLTCVTRAKVKRLLALRPDLAMDLIQRMVQRVRTPMLTVGRLALVDVYGQLACSTRWPSKSKAGAWCRTR